MTTARDQAFMWMALNEARKGEGRTSPNPVVGAVIVKDGRVVATGYHHRAGDAHAEEEALMIAGEAARGADVFVSLEPCCHRGRRQPCTQALVTAGVRRVIAGVIDPNPLVSGKGLAALRAAGIEVVCGVLEDECRATNAAFFKYIKSGRPYVTAKYAMTLDGKTATRTGDSKWISGPASRQLAHQLRDQHDAVMVGSRTLALDDPQLTTRGICGGRDPIRVVLDPRGEISASARVLDGASAAPTWVICGEAAAGQVRARLSERDDVIALPSGPNGRLAVSEILSALAQREVMTLLVEGGGETAAGLFEAGQVDRVVAFVAPLLSGGRAAATPLGGLGVETISQGSRLTNVTVRRVGQDLVVFGRVEGS